MVRGRAMPPLYTVISSCISSSSVTARVAHQISGASKLAVLLRKQEARLSASKYNSHRRESPCILELGKRTLHSSCCPRVGLGLSVGKHRSDPPQWRKSHPLQLLARSSSSSSSSRSSFSSASLQNSGVSAAADVVMAGASGRKPENENDDDMSRPGNVQQALDSPRSASSDTKKKNKKTKRMCYYHTQGLCTKMDDPSHLAKFAHEFPALSVRADDAEKVKLQPFDFFLVLDLEGMVEILEFPVVIIDAKTLQVIDRFHRFVRPTKMTEERIAEYIGNKYGPWGLDRVWHDTAVPFADVLVAFEAWLEQHGLWNTKERKQKLFSAAFVTCGNWDIKTKIPDQCVTSKIDLPAYFNEWINLKDIYCNFYKFKASGMLKMMKGLKMDLIGTHHVGLDDAHNIARVLQRMLAHGATVRLTASREPGSPKTVKFAFRFRIK